MLKKTLQTIQKKRFSYHGKEILHGYVELCTMKKKDYYHQENRNAFASPNDASFHFIEGSSQQRNNAKHPFYRTFDCTVTL